MLPDGSAEQYHWYNELQRVSATPDVAERHLAASAEIDIRDLLPQVTSPTLVLHCRDDADTPFPLGEELAAGIPGARLVPLPGRNHLFLAGTPAHRGFFQAVAAFLGDPPPRGGLPGVSSQWERIDITVKRVEQNWLVKLAAILTAVAGLLILLYQAVGALAGAGG